MNIEYILLDVHDLEPIRPLWQKLNGHHGGKSPHFAEFYAKFTFSERTAAIFRNQQAKFRIEAAKDSEAEQLVGYCISSVNEQEEGEVESIYIEPGYRGKRIGDVLMKNSLAWMESEQVKIKRVTVAAGNETAFGFYEKYGFFPRLTVLQSKA